MHKLLAGLHSAYLVECSCGGGVRGGLVVGGQLEQVIITKPGSRAGAWA